MQKIEKKVKRQKQKQREKRENVRKICVFSCERGSVWLRWLRGDDCASCASCTVSLLHLKRERERGSKSGRERETERKRERESARANELRCTVEQKKCEVVNIRGQLRPLKVYIFLIKINRGVKLALSVILSVRLSVYSCVCLLQSN